MNEFVKPVEVIEPAQSDEALVASELDLARDALLAKIALERQAVQAEARDLPAGAAESPAYTEVAHKLAALFHQERLLRHGE